MDTDRPRAGITSLPTPIEAKPDLGTELGVPDLHVKLEREAGDPYGGNKIRKLDLLLGDALERDYTRVLTGGSIGSNHVLATATYAREVGLQPAAIQFPEPVTEHVRDNLRALAAFDPELTLLKSEYRFLIRLFAERIRSRFDDKTYYIPPGGSSPLGALGYVEAIEELKRQISAGEVPPPDVLVVPTSSGGTHAGLHVGVDYFNLDTSVVGVQVAPRTVTNRWRIARLATAVAKRIDGPTSRYRRSDITLLTGHMGEGYAAPTTEATRVSEIAARHGLHLDKTYTAKAVAALATEFTEKTVLYWHTLDSDHPRFLGDQEAQKRLPAAYSNVFA